jgi:hypothetical protein
LIKQVRATCPFDKELEIIDLKVDASGPKEDELYANVPALLKNIRRGNTAIIVPEYKKPILVRQGLVKFFDLRLAYVSSEHRQDLSLKDFKPEKHMEKAYILAPVLRCMAEGGSVEVFKTLKANGENVQISYSEVAERWVVASKNVALLANTHKEVSMYGTKGRYQFASEMAHVWIDILA